MKFIHFGCWNKGECDKKTNENPLSQVMNKLATRVKGMDLKTDFIIVAGDNYYSDKEKQPKKGGPSTEAKEPKKQHLLTDEEKDKLKSGFDCLDVKIPVYIIYGNHDVINKKDKDCLILTTQQEIENQQKIEHQQKAKKHQKAKLPRLKLFTDVITEHPTDDTCIIMFDSSLYTLPEKEEVGNVTLATLVKDSCYKHLFPKFHRDVSATLKKLRDDQTKQIVDKFNEIVATNRNIIFVAHHPLVNTKPVEKGKHKDNFIANLIRLFKDSIGAEYIGLICKPTIYYLCADYHVYQQMSIDILLDNGTYLTINQYTVGTGGATLDKINPTLVLEEETTLNITPETPLTLKYTVISQKDKHGFLEVEVPETKGPIVFKFIEVPILPPILPPSKSHRKYLKYKMKYLDLKLRLYNTS